jgi:hypothetical protein
MMNMLRVALFVGAIWSAVFAVRWVLGPLDRAAKNRNCPVQFSLADFLCLFFVVQLLLIAPAALFRGISFWTLAVDYKVLIVTAWSLFFALAIIFWWTGVRKLSRAGVQSTASRAFVLTIAIPFGFAFAIAIPIVALVAFAFLSQNSELLGTVRSIEAIMLMLVSESAIISVVWAMGVLTRHIVTVSKRQQDAIQPRSPDDGSITASPATPSQSISPN